MIQIPAIALPHKPRRGESFDLTLTRLGPKGHGEAVWQTAIGPTGVERTLIFEVPRALPGDRVRVSVVSVKKNRVRAYVTSSIERSAGQVLPRCSHVGFPEDPTGACGGCVIQGLSYDAQLTSKMDLLTRLLGSAGLDTSIIRPPHGMGSPWFYRNKMEYSFGWNREGELAVGLHPFGRRHDILKLDTCHLQSEVSSDIVKLARQWVEQSGVCPYRPSKGEGFLRTLTIREGKRTGQRMVELTTTGDETTRYKGEVVTAVDVAGAFLEHLRQSSLSPLIHSVYWTAHRTQKGSPSSLEHHHLWGESVLREELHLFDDKVLKFEVHPRAFFQPNTHQAEVLYTEVLQAAGLMDGSEKAPRILDLYCGTGTIAIVLASLGARVTGVEIHEPAVSNARRNAALNGVTSADFLVGDVGEILADEGHDELRRANVLIVDPPRAGLMHLAIVHLAATTASRLVYVSCNPVSLARDAKLLLEAGWQLKSIQPVDMFPHTAHIENVATFRR